MYAGYSKRYGDLLKYDVEEELRRFEQYRVSLAKYTVDAIALMKDAQDKDTEILIEGANALMLDIDYGTVRHFQRDRISSTATARLPPQGVSSTNFFSRSIPMLLRPIRAWAASLLASPSTPGKSARLLGMNIRTRREYKIVSDLAGINSVVKAYTTRVGEGPFATEDLGE